MMPNLKEKILKEFARRFRIAQMLGKGWEDDIESFLSSALSEVEEATRKEIEEKAVCFRND